MSGVGAGRERLTDLGIAIRRFVSAAQDAEHVYKMEEGNGDGDGDGDGKSSMGSWREPRRDDG